MCALHEIKGKRFNRYHELGQYAFGQRLGLWLVIPCQVDSLLDPKDLLPEVHKPHRAGVPCGLPPSVIIAHIALC